MEEKNADSLTGRLIHMCGCVYGFVCFSYIGNVKLPSSHMYNGFWVIRLNAVA